MRLASRGELCAYCIVASLDPHSRIDVDSPISLKVNLQTLHVFDPETDATLV